jgi:hypothetical protein
MFLSKLKKKKAALPPVETRLCKKLHAVLLRVAAYLQQQTKRCSVRTQHYMLFTGCLLSAAACTLVVVSSFQNNSSGVKITPIHVSPVALKTGAEGLKSVNPITEKEYIQIIGFCRYLDSLRQTPRGRTVHFRLLYNRRGLLDSLRQVETLYHIQQQLKQ